METIKSLLTEIAIAVLKGVKVFVVYMIPSFIIALFTSPQFLTAVQTGKYDSSILVPVIINLALVAIAGGIKNNTDNKTINKVF